MRWKWQTRKFFGLSMLLIALILLGCLAIFRFTRPRHLHSQAKAAVARHRWDEATQHLENLLRRQPDDAEALDLMAQVCESRGDITRAVEYLGHIPPDAPRAASIRLRQGILLLQLHRGIEAEQALRHALEREPRLLKAQQALTWYCGLLQRTEEALELLWQSYAQGEQLADRVLALTRIVTLRSGLDLAEYLQDLEQFATNAPEDLETNMALAAAYVQCGKVDEGIRLLESCLNAAPDSHDVRMALAEVYLKIRRFADAGEIIRPLEPQLVDDRRLWLISGQIAEDRMDWKVACANYEKALKCAPTDGQTHGRLSTVLEQLGQSDKARKHREVALRLNQARARLEVAPQRLALEIRPGHTPKLDQLCFQIASLCEELGWKAEAGAWYREVLALSPNDPEANRRYGELVQFITPRTVTKPRLSTVRALGPIAVDVRAATAARDRELSAGRSRIRFRDASAEAGIRFDYANGAQGLYAMRETMGAGVATFDYDGDGHVDVFLVNSGTDAQTSAPASDLSQLLRTRGSLRCEDVTARAGLAVAEYFQGCAAADYDNDGFDDLYLSGYRTHRLFHNNGDGTFRDATDTLGPVPSLWGTSAAFADLMGDGNLDLYVATYLKDNPHLPSPCKGPMGELQYCPPHPFEAEQDRLYVNRGAGVFEEKAEQFVPTATGGKSLGVVIADLNDDHRPDIFVANDRTPNLLFLNEGGGHFIDDGMVRGAALGSDGTARAGMGVACGNTANRGSLDLLITNFHLEPNTLLWNLGHGWFEDRGVWAGLAGPSYFHVGFGTLFLDGDNDGCLDLFVTNGHINRDSTGRVPQAMPPQLFANLGDGRFHDISRNSGSYFQSVYIGRGVAGADFDNDGLMDLVVTHQENAATLLMNETPGAGRSVTLHLIGRRSNRTGIGARVTAVLGDRRLMRELIGGGSYLSSSQPVVCFGLGALPALDSLEVQWPWGETQTLGPITHGRWLLYEGSPPRRLPEE